MSAAVAAAAWPDANAATPGVAPDPNAKAPQSDDFTAAYKAIVGDTEIIETGITLELPQIAENGNFVPVTITVDSPMTDADHIRRIHLLSTANPIAKVATYHLSPINGLARVQSRMRLAKTQDVYIVAERSDGAKIVGSAVVKVTIGGCGAGD